ncbi:MAG: hypothetical protein KBG04_02770 [Bacteroidales bacterium]|jgi:uncharacterized membrane protein YhdT|nr:hypothetical protein [Bacteroidales bacterium]
MKAEDLKQEMIQNIDRPEILERLYRNNPQEFTRVFTEIAHQFDSDLIRIWKIRLEPDTVVEQKVFPTSEIWFLVILSLLTGLLVKLPNIFSQIQSSAFYTRDVSIIVLNGIIVYFFWQNKLFDLKKIALYFCNILILTLFVNLLPFSGGDSLNLVFLFTPFYLWCWLGLVYVSFDYKNMSKRIEFIRFNGEFIIMTGLVLAAGALLTFVTIGLFSVIRVDIEKFYTDYVVVFGGVAAPIVSAYLIKKYPNMSSKIAPVIARVFTPLVFITLIIYLVSLIFSKSKIFEDRDLLLILNIALVCIMAIIVFSVSELDKTKDRNANVLILFLLSVVAIIINMIALTAIISRITGGFTPNRTVVLGSNILIFINLILMARSLFQSYYHANNLQSVERVLAQYLSIYFGWTIIVIYVLPFVFRFQ